MYIYKYVRACVFQKYAWLARFVNLMLIDFCESYADKIFVNLIVIKRTIHGEAVVYMCVTSRELCFLLD